MIIRDARDQLPVRISFGIFQEPFNLSNGFLAQYMFNLFCIIMNMIGFIVSFIGEVKFPESMISYNSACILPAFGRESQNCLRRKVCGRVQAKIFGGQSGMG